MSWGESGQFEAVSLLYDISIFVYFDNMKHWNVYNKNGSASHLCLINAHEVFYTDNDILRSHNYNEKLVTVLNNMCTKHSIFFHRVVALSTNIL